MAQSQKIVYMDPHLKVLLGVVPPIYSETTVLPEKHLRPSSPVAPQRLPLFFHRCPSGLHGFAVQSRGISGPSRQDPTSCQKAPAFVFEHGPVDVTSWIKDGGRSKESFTLSTKIDWKQCLKRCLEGVHCSLIESIWGSLCKILETYYNTHFLIVVLIL